MKYPYVIIDDDTVSRKEIQSVVEDFTNFLCVGTSGNYDDGLHLILEHSPELVFLELASVVKHQNKIFALLEELSLYLKKLPKIVVITSSKEWAYEAIKNQVYDYIIKPLDPGDLRKTMLRILEESWFYNGKISSVATARCKIGQNQTLCIKSYGDYRFVDTKNILYLKADNNSTDIFLKDGIVITAFKTLKHFENTLPMPFVRVHNSYMVNSSHIFRIHFGSSLCFFKNTKIKIPFSRTYKKNIYLIIQRISSLNQ